MFPDQNHCTNLKKHIQDLITDGGASLSVEFQGVSLKNLLIYIVDFLDDREKVLNQWREMKDELYSNNKTLQLKVNELELNISAKNKCLQQFKEDLSSKFIYTENLREYNKKLVCRINLVEKEIDQLKLSEEWFKNLLNMCQIKRNELKCQLISKEIVETLHHSKETEQNVDNEHISKETSKDMRNIATQTDYYNETEQKISYLVKLRERYSEIFSSKQVMEEINSNIKLNSKFEGNCGIFQKSVLHTNSIIDSFENIKKQLCAKLITSTKNGKNKNAEILHLMQDIDSLKSEVLQQQKEKENVEVIVSEINDKFIKLKNVHETLKIEIIKKDKIIQDLKNEKSRFEDRELDKELKIKDLSKAVHRLQIEKDELTNMYYEEICSCTNKLRTIQRNLDKKHIENIELQKEIDKKYLDVNEVERRYELKIKFLQEKYANTNIERQYLIEIFQLCKILYFNQDEKNHSNLDEIFMSSEEIGTEIINLIRSRKENNEKIKNDVSNHLKYIKAKLGDMSLKCSKNEKMLNEMKNLDFSKLLRKTKWLRIFFEVKEQEKLEQRKRFEKYNRILLSQIKKYKKSFLKSEEHIGYLENLCNFYASKIQYIENSNENKHSNFPLENCTCRSSQTRKYSERDSNLQGEVAVIHLAAKNENLLKHSTDENPEFSQEITQLEHESELKSFVIKQSEEELLKNSQQITELTQKLSQRDKLLEKTSRLLQNEIEVLKATHEHDSMTINELKKVKLNLQDELNRRDILLCKLFMVFKMKISSIESEANDKFFLQRLCSDLKAALRIYSGQNKVLQRILQIQSLRSVSIKESSICTIKDKIYSEKYIKTLVRKGKDSSDIMDSCADIRCHINSIKDEVGFLQSIVSKR